MGIQINKLYGIAFFIKTRISKLAIIDKSARRISDERPKRSC